jgi:5-methylcytosine-specific restriction endonuclease McrA
MGIALLIFVVVLACLAGWIAHAIEKSLRNRQPPCEERKPVSTYQQPTETRYSLQKSSPIEQDSVTPRQQTKIDQPSRLKIEPTGVESRFDDWQGTGEEKYPPDWKFRSAAIRKRDGDRCQVAGCPSLGVKHVHHLDSIRNGGTHVLSNLITLCEFHHALMPDHLEAIGQNLENARFSVRLGHTRRNQVNLGFHSVRPSIVRRETASKNNILEMVQSFGCLCTNPKCSRQDFECEHIKEMSDLRGWAQFDDAKKAVMCEWRLICQHCGCAKYFQGGILEEIGLILESTFPNHLPTNLKLKQYEDSWLEDFDSIEASGCPRSVSDCLGHLIWKRNRNDGSCFLRCSEHFKTGCKGRY